MFEILGKICLDKKGKVMLKKTKKVKFSNVRLDKDK